MISKINFFFFFLIICSISLQAEYLDPHTNPCDIIPEIVNLPVWADTYLGPVPLVGSPAGGVFSGNGVLFNGFNPILAGPGIHEITYTYTDPATGCVSQAMESILVFTIFEVWVFYNLGVIQPKLAATTETIIEQSETYDLLISDLNGNILHETKTGFTKGFRFNHFSETNLPYGIYVATFRSDKHTFSKQIILGR